MWCSEPTGRADGNHRVDQERIVYVSGTIADRNLGAIIEDLRPALASIPARTVMRFDSAASGEDQQESFRELTFAAILALLLVYMVMAAQFESLRDPFIILFSIPLAAIGVVTMLVITGNDVQHAGVLGVIVLVGIVVNNAIVLIDYTNQLRRQHGYGIIDSVVTAGGRRLRPILMTTVTTILGLTPMALGLGEGSELQVPMARGRDRRPADIHADHSGVHPGRLRHVGRAGGSLGASSAQGLCSRAVATSGGGLG